MNAVYDKTNSELYSARNFHQPINFYCAAPRAKYVQLAGDFNHWHPITMHPRDDGWWSIQVMLVHGHHQSRFLVDGQPMLE